MSDLERPSRERFLAIVASAIDAHARSSADSTRAPIEISARLRARTRQWMGGRVPGVSVGWIDGERSGTYEVGSAAAGRDVDLQTVFEAASLSKPAFALGVIGLHARGRLDLDVPISKTVDLRNETDDDRVFRITPRHALTHTTGLANWRFEPGPLRCAFAPGSRFSYSGEGMFLLQRVVEHVTGRGLAEFMTSDVLGPLGMTSSSYAYGRRLRHRLAVPHDARGKALEHRTAILGEQFVRAAERRDVPLERWRWSDVERILPRLDPPQRPLPVFSPINAATSLLTTARDYTKILRALTRERAMTKPEISVAPDISWGLGVGIETGRESFAFHWGDNDGFKAIFETNARFPRGVVVLTNGDSGIPVAARIERALLGSAHPSLSWIEAKYV